MASMLTPLHTHAPDCASGVEKLAVPHHQGMYNDVVQLNSRAMLVAILEKAATKWKGRSLDRLV
jgi:hypothetical protein